MSNKEKDKSSEAIPIAIVGMECAFPKAKDCSAYWNNIKKNVDAITTIPASHWNIKDYFDEDPTAPDRTSTTRGGFLDPVDFNPLEFGITPNAIEATDTAQLLSLILAQKALADAGYNDLNKIDRDKVSVILGVTGTLELVIPLGARLGHPIWRRAMKECGIEGDLAEDVISKISGSYVNWQENSFPGLLGNVTAGRIANRLDLGGTNCVVDAACASSLSALHMGVLELTSGRSNMVITGGIDTFNDIFMYMCFSKTQVLSPTGDARPFDQNADGTVLGEGIGIIVLKRLDDAERDGDKIYSVIRGIGSSSDGKGNAIYVPSSKGQSKALQRAFDQANVTPNTVELVEAHGTGTKVGDATEVDALTKVYAPHGHDQTWCAVGSVKSQIGHTKAAAGIAGIIKSALALHNKILPPTLKVSRPTDTINDPSTPFYINTEQRPWMQSSDHPRRAAVSAFGFGGSNFHCILEEYSSKEEKVGWDPDLELFAYATDSLDELKQHLKAFPVKESWEDLSVYAKKVRKEFSSKKEYRLTFIIQQDQSDIPALITTIADRVSKSGGDVSWKTPQGVFFSKGKSKGKLAFLFPGQGSQYVGMLRDLACTFPQIKKVLNEANSTFASQENVDPLKKLTDFIYPFSAFSDEEAQNNENKLKNTKIAQPAIGAVSLGALEILSFFGIKPDATAGHSYGELTALCAGLRFDQSSLHQLSGIRGHLMAQKNGSSGTMLAVRADAQKVADLIQKENIDLVIANKNAPEQSVLSGSRTEIAKASKKFSEQKIANTELPVSAAFHSRFVSEFKKPFHSALCSVDFSDSEITVFANTTALEYPTDPDQARTVLSGQLAEPVEFLAQIQNMHKAGITTFIEVGPGKKLTGLVQKILADSDHSAFALDSSSGKKSGMLDLACMLGRLASEGYSVNLEKWNQDIRTVQKENTSKKSQLTIPICGANHFTPKPVQTKTNNEQKMSQNKTTDSIRPIERHKATEDPITTKKVFMTEESTNRLSSAIPVQKAHISEQLQALQTNMSALQKLQEQTANLHQQFLQGQERSQQALVLLIDQQSSIFGQGSVTARTLNSRITTFAEKTMQQVPIQDTPVERNEQEAVQNRDTEIRHVEQNNSNNQTAEVIQLLLNIVSEKTGYPVEMLDLNMALDSDLGIDSIKQVEILSAIQEKLPNAPEVRPDQMGELQTLSQLATHLSDGAISIDPLSNPVNTSTKEDSQPKEDVLQVLLEIVSEKTGYPVEVIQPDMGLDCDLGIDSIKQVEILSAVQEKIPHAPEVRPDQMGQLQTLNQLALFLNSGTEENHSVQENQNTANISTILDSLLHVIAEKTGYPMDILEPDMGLDSDLGIDSIKQVEILSAIQEKHPEAPEVRPDQMGELQTIRQLGEFLAGNNSSEIAESPATQPIQKNKLKTITVPQAVITPDVFRSVLKCEDLNGHTKRPLDHIGKGSEIWITEDGTELTTAVEKLLRKQGYIPKIITLSELQSLEKPDHLGGVLVLTPQKQLEEAFLKNTFKMIRLAGQGLKAAAKNGGAIFATVSKMDGAFGLNGKDARFNPLSGGLAGFAKTIQREWPEVRCKAIDIAPTLTETLSCKKVASYIFEEMFNNGPIEIGISGKGRSALHLDPVPLQDAIAGQHPFTTNDVIIITGGARGVTAEVSVSLAQQFKPTIVLFGRSPLPQTEPDWLVQLFTEQDIKKAILGQSGRDKVTPKQIDKEYKQIMAAREIRKTVKRIEDTGAPCFYDSVDVRDSSAVEVALEKVRKEQGTITGLIHGAGVLADKLIEEKSDEQFDEVYGTKVSSLQLLLQCLQNDPLTFMVFFSSVTGRFGRIGQIDYAVANEILNKTAQQQAYLRPSCRVLSINWGPWDGGMVTPSLRKIFKDEGVDLIDPYAGANYLIREITSQSDPYVEVVVMGSENQIGEKKESMNMAFEKIVNIDSCPFLTSHVINDKAVLPAAIMIEWMGNGALHSNPGLAFHGFNDFRILKGVAINANASENIQIFTGSTVKKDGLFFVPVEIRTINKNKSFRLHASAEVLLTATLPTPEKAGSLKKFSPYNMSVESAYNNILFHGSMLQSITEIEGCSEDGISAYSKTSHHPKEWVKEPLRSKWLSDPLAIDCAFQLMILWATQEYGAGSLPCFAGKYRQFVKSFPNQGVQIEVSITKSTHNSAKADINFIDNETGKVVARMEEYECTINKSLNLSFQKNRLTRALV